MLETIQRILSPTNAPYINGVHAELRFSKALLENMYQGLIEKDGLGVNDNFVTEGDAESAAQVQVHRVKPIRMKPREQGANKNGASFSAHQHYSLTETVGIDILTTMDDPIIIPRARQDMIPVDLLAKQTQIFSDRLNTVLNGATFASKVIRVFDSAETERNVTVISSSDVTNKTVLERFVEANSLLDEGDARHGIDIFPEDTRIGVFKVGYRATLKVAGILSIGGANAAYDAVKGSGLNAGETARRSTDGYIGTIDGVPCHVISNESLSHASEFLGFPATEIKNSPLVGYIASSYANARGVSTSKLTKVVDAQAGQGVVLQPFVKFGVESWYPKGTSLFLSKSGYSPIDALKTLFPSTNFNITYKIKGAGSRLFPEVKNAVWTVSASSFKLEGVTAYDDADYNHIEGAYFYVGTAEATSVADFLEKEADATYKGTFVVGEAESTTIADGEYVNVLVISDDGSIALLSKKYSA